MGILRRVTLVQLAVCLLSTQPSWAGWCPVSERACGLEGLASNVVEGLIRVESGGRPWGLHVGIGKGYAFYPKSWREVRSSWTLETEVRGRRRASASNAGATAGGWEAWTAECGLTAGKSARYANAAMRCGRKGARHRFRSAD